MTLFTTLVLCLNLANNSIVRPEASYYSKTANDARMVIMLIKQNEPMANRIVVEQLIPNTRVTICPAGYEPVRVERLNKDG